MIQPVNLTEINIKNFKHKLNLFDLSSKMDYIFYLDINMKIHDDIGYIKIENKILARAIN